MPGRDRPDGVEDSFPLRVNHTGRVVGHSVRFDADVNVGQSAWFFDPASETNRRIGFVDATHTGKEGTRIGESQSGLYVLISVPAPGSGGVIALAGIASLRRRR